MMKKNFSKALSGILTMALLLSVAVLPGAFHVSAANENPVLRSEITLTDTDPENSGTLAKYDLLANPDEGLSMEVGDTYVFDMDIYMTRYSGSTALPFGFDLLGNPTAVNGAEVKVAGVEFANRGVLRWVPGTSYNGWVTDKRFNIWGNGNYHYRFTVKAYESLRVEFCYSVGYNEEKREFDATVAWDQMYGLSDCKPGDGKLFYPNMAFLDQDGKISNISVRCTEKTRETIKTVKEITLTDADAENEGTMTKYDLLKDPTAGLTMEEGGTYVFEMNILANSHHNGGTARPFGFDLLGNPTKQGGGIKLSGIEFSNKNVLYWIANGAWESYIDQSQTITLWGGGTYHYRFTVKAYESIQVEIWTASTANINSNYPDSTVEYNATVEWSKVYGLSTVKAGDGTRFYPNMTFLDQNGKITNIHAVYIPAAEDEDVVIESFSDISAYRTAGAYTAPTKDGYVFAGWFTDTEATSPVADETTNVYAKFVTQDVLSVKGQLKAGTTAESLNTDYRFSTTVDSLNYQNIGFNITVNGNTKSPSSTTVYKKITARSGNEIIAHDPTVFSAVSQYFHTYTITGIPQSAFATEIQIAAYGTTLDGTVVTGPARTLTVNMGIN
mgnify:CR=1 FL=1